MTNITTMPTGTCPFCGRPSFVELNEVQWGELRNLVAHPSLLIQEATPSMTADQRELLITGTHPECWDEAMTYWAEKDEAEEDAEDFDPDDEREPARSFEREPAEPDPDAWQIGQDRYERSFR